MATNNNVFDYLQLRPINEALLSIPTARPGAPSAGASLAANNSLTGLLGAAQPSGIQGLALPQSFAQYATPQPAAITTSGLPQPQQGGGFSGIGDSNFAYSDAIKPSANARIKLNDDLTKFRESLAKQAQNNSARNRAAQAQAQAMAEYAQSLERSVAADQRARAQALQQKRDANLKAQGNKQGLNDDYSYLTTDLVNRLLTSEQWQNVGSDLERTDKTNRELANLEQALRARGGDEIAIQNELANARNLMETDTRRFKNELERDSGTFSFFKDIGLSAASMVPQTLAAGTALIGLQDTTASLMGAADWIESGKSGKSKLDYANLAYLNEKDEAENPNRSWATQIGDYIGNIGKSGATITVAKDLVGSMIPSIVTGGLGSLAAKGVGSAISTSKFVAQGSGVLSKSGRIIGTGIANNAGRVSSTITAGMFGGADAAQGAYSDVMNTDFQTLQDNFRKNYGDADWNALVASHNGDEDAIKRELATNSAGRAVVRTAPMVALLGPFGLEGIAGRAASGKAASLGRLRVAASVAGATASEGLEEGLTQFGGNWGQNPYTGVAYDKDVASSAALGAIAGGTLGTPLSILEARNRANRLAPEMTPSTDTAGMFDPANARNENGQFDADLFKQNVTSAMQGVMDRAQAAKLSDTKALSLVHMLYNNELDKPEVWQSMTKEEYDNLHDHLDKMFNISGNDYVKYSGSYIERMFDGGDLQAIKDLSDRMKQGGGRDTNGNLIDNEGLDHWVNVYRVLNGEEMSEVPSEDMGMYEAMAAVYQNLKNLPTNHTTADRFKAHSEFVNSEDFEKNYGVHLTNEERSQVGDFGFIELDAGMRRITDSEQKRIDSAAGYSSKSERMYDAYAKGITPEEALDPTINPRTNNGTPNGNPAQANNQSGQQQGSTQGGQANGQPQQTSNNASQAGNGQGQGGQQRGQGQAQADASQSPQQGNGTGGAGNQGTGNQTSQVGGNGGQGQTNGNAQGTGTNVAQQGADSNNQANNTSQGGSGSGQNTTGQSGNTNVGQSQTTQPTGRSGQTPAGSGTSGTSTPNQGPVAGTNPTTAQTPNGSGVAGNGQTGSGANSTGSAASQTTGQTIRPWVKRVSVEQAQRAYDDLPKHLKKVADDAARKAGKARNKAGFLQDLLSQPVNQLPKNASTWGTSESGLRSLTNALKAARDFLNHPMRRFEVVTIQNRQNSANYPYVSDITNNYRLSKTDVSSLAKYVKAMYGFDYMKTNPAFNTRLVGRMIADLAGLDEKMRNNRLSVRLFGTPYDLKTSLSTRINRLVDDVLESNVITGPLEQRSPELSEQLDLTKTSAIVGRLNRKNYELLKNEVQSNGLDGTFGDVVAYTRAMMNTIEEGHDLGQFISQPSKLTRRNEIVGLVNRIHRAVQSNALADQEAGRRWVRMAPYSQLAPKVRDKLLQMMRTGTGNLYDFGGNVFQTKAGVTGDSLVFPSNARIPTGIPVEAVMEPITEAIEQMGVLGDYNIYPIVENVIPAYSEVFKEYSQPRQNRENNLGRRAAGAKRDSVQEQFARIVIDVANSIGADIANAINNQNGNPGGPTQGTLNFNQQVNTNGSNDSNPDNNAGNSTTPSRAGSGTTQTRQTVTGAGQQGQNTTGQTQRGVGNENQQGTDGQQFDQEPSNSDAVQGGQNTNGNNAASNDRQGSLFRQAINPDEAQQGQAGDGATTGNTASQTQTLVEAPAPESPDAPARTENTQETSSDIEGNPAGSISNDETNDTAYNEGDLSPQERTEIENLASDMEVTKDDLYSAIVNGNTDLFDDGGQTSGASRDEIAQKLVDLDAAPDMGTARSMIDRLTGGQEQSTPDNSESVQQFIDENREDAQAVADHLQETGNEQNTQAFIEDEITDDTGNLHENREAVAPSLPERVRDALRRAWDFVRSNVRRLVAAGAAAATIGGASPAMAQDSYNQNVQQVQTVSSEEFTNTNDTVIPSDPKFDNASNGRVSMSADDYMNGVSDVQNVRTPPAQASEPVQIEGQPQSTEDVRTDPVVINGVTFTGVNMPEGQYTPADYMANGTFNSEPISGDTRSEGFNIFNLAVLLAGGYGARRIYRNRRAKKAMKDETGTPRNPQEKGEPARQKTANDVLQKEHNEKVANSRKNYSEAPENLKAAPQKTKGIDNISRNAWMKYMANWSDFVSNPDSDSTFNVLQNLDNMTAMLDDAMKDDSLAAGNAYQYQQQARRWTFAKIQDDQRLGRMSFIMNGIAGATQNFDNLMTDLNMPRIGIEADSSKPSAILASVRTKGEGAFSRMYKKFLRPMERSTMELASDLRRATEEVEQDVGTLLTLRHIKNEAADRMFSDRQKIIDELQRQIDAIAGRIQNIPADQDLRASLINAQSRAQDQINQQKDELKAMQDAYRGTVEWDGKTKLPGGYTEAQIDAKIAQLQDKWGSDFSRIEDNSRKLARTIRQIRDWAATQGAFDAEELRIFEERGFEEYAPLYRPRQDPRQQDSPDSYTKMSEMDKIYQNIAADVVKSLGLAKNLTAYRREGSTTPAADAYTNMKTLAINLSARVGQKPFEKVIQQMYEGTVDKSFSGMVITDQDQLDSINGEPESQFVPGLVRYAPGSEQYVARQERDEFRGIKPIIAKGYDKNGMLKTYHYYFTEPAIQREVYGNYTVNEPLSMIASKNLATITRFGGRMMTTFKPLWNVWNWARDSLERLSIMLMRQVVDKNGKKLGKFATARAYFGNLAKLTGSLTAQQEIYRYLTTGETETRLQRVLDEAVGSGAITLMTSQTTKNQVLGDLSQSSLQRWGNQISKMMGTGFNRAGAGQTRMMITDSLDWYVTRMTEVPQVTTGLAAYLAYRQLGVNQAETANRVRDQFDPLRANNTLMTSVSPFFPFVRSTLSGHYNLIRSLTEYWKPGEWQWTTLYTVGGTALAYMLYTMAGSLFGDDDDGKPRLARMQTGMLTQGLPVPVGENGSFSIPVGFGLHSVMFGIAGNLYKLSHGTQTAGETMANMAGIVLDNTSPSQTASGQTFSENPAAASLLSVSPLLVKPIVEMAVNAKSFGGGKIYNMDTPADERASEQDNFNTPQDYKDMAKWLNSSFGIDVRPESVQHVMESYAWGPLAAVPRSVFADTGDRTFGNRESKGEIYGPLGVALGADLGIQPNSVDLANFSYDMQNFALAMNRKTGVPRTHSKEEYAQYGITSGEHQAAELTRRKLIERGESQLMTDFIYNSMVAEDDRKKATKNLRDIAKAIQQMRAQGQEPSIELLNQAQAAWDTVNQINENYIMQNKEQFSDLVRVEG